MSGTHNTSMEATRMEEEERGRADRRTTPGKPAAGEGEKLAMPWRIAGDVPREVRVTPGLVLRELHAHNFAVLSTVDEEGEPDSAGVNYGVSAAGQELALYVMTRRHLKKARNLLRNPHVSLVVPLPRRILQFVPPATIQLRGRAEILDWTDKQGREVFRRFWMGRRILAAYEESSGLGEIRICFLKITLDPVIRTYAVGYSAWDLRRHMESAAARVTIPPWRPGARVGPTTP